MLYHAACVVIISPHCEYLEGDTVDYNYLFASMEKLYM
jgi:hypothetical protein